MLSLAQIAEFDTIADEGLRAQCQARGLMLGRALAVGRSDFTSMAQVLDFARALNKEDYL